MNEFLLQLNELFAPVYWGNSLRDWLIALIIILFSTTLARAAYWLILKTFKKLTAKTETHLDDMLVAIIEKPLVMSLMLVGMWLGLTWLTLPEKMDAVIEGIVEFVITLLVAWVLVRMIDVLINEHLRPLAEKSDSSLDDQLLPILQKGSKILIWAMALIICLNNAGYDVAALLAGLGIGGIALAMAAKDTIANVFGGFTILTDRPFQINDRIKIVGYDGTVTDIGVRSTRLKTMEGRTVTIPNSKFAESPVENISWEPSRKITLELGLTYDTTPQQMKHALELLRHIAESNKDIEKGASAFFSTLGSSALNITFIYYIRKAADIAATQSAVNFAILSRFNRAKLAFAFPTQTVYTVSVGK